MTKEIILPSSWDIMRYTKRSFPAYRFVPGVHPHPTEHPDGHSYRKSEEPILALTEDNWHRNEQYLYGIDLYNHCFWWEAHEAWEGMWGETKKGDTTSHFLQGLIQVSAAFLKWHLKEKRGVESLFRSGRGYLEKARAQSPLYRGLDLTRHLEKLDKAFTADRIGQLSDPLIGYPFIILETFPG